MVGYALVQVVSIFPNGTNRLPAANQELVVIRGTSEPQVLRCLWCQKLHGDAKVYISLKENIRSRDHMFDMLTSLIRL